MRELAIALVGLVVACGGTPPARSTSAGSSTATGACVDTDCESRCASNDAAACARAAELYFDGHSGHALDMTKSFRFASQACAGGDMLGCMFVGYHHQDGLGAAWDPAKAVAAYERSCKGGAGIGCFNLASMYSGGHGVDLDAAKAAAYTAQATAAWEVACKGSDPRWCTNVAFVLAASGEPTAATKQAMIALDQRTCDAKILVGCVEVARLAFQLGSLEPGAYVAELERLCSAGEPTGCKHAGLALLGGMRMQQDVKRGIALLAQSCEAGEKTACHFIGMVTSEGESVPKDDAAATRYLTMACDRAHRPSCFKLAELHGAAGRDTEMVSFARRACHMGDSESCGIVAAGYRAGRGVERSPAEAIRYLREACRAGFMPGCSVLIELDLELPIPADYRTKLYTQACERNIAKSCERLRAK